VPFIRTTHVLVVKRTDLFAFRNPGAMRMPVETALRGGVSDCRNRRLQDMFRYVGLGEQAGSGIPKIQSAWRTQHWRSPEKMEQVEPYEQTIFTLRMASLLPAEVVQALEQRFGAGFDQASEVQKLALVTAAVERCCVLLGRRQPAHLRGGRERRGDLPDRGHAPRELHLRPAREPRDDEHPRGPDQLLQPVQQQPALGRVPAGPHDLVRLRLELARGPELRPALLRERLEPAQLS